MMAVEAEATGRSTGRIAGANERRFARPLLRILSASLWRLLGRTFDRRVGVETQEARWPHEMAVGGVNAAHGYEYSASPARSFWLSAGSLDIDPRRFTFVDIGSGKGRVLLLAAQLPFRRIEGVEFASDLDRIAARNIARAYPSPAERARFRLHALDAAAYAIPTGPCVIYLYNPFGPALVETLAERILASYRAAPREIYVVYVNPRHRDVFERAAYAPVASPWYARWLDRFAPYGFAIYRPHGSVYHAAIPR